MNTQRFTTTVLIAANLFLAQTLGTGMMPRKHGTLGMTSSSPQEYPSPLACVSMARVFWPQKEKLLNCD